MSVYAELCTNWRDISEAKEMICLAKENGAEKAKFQLFDPIPETNPWAKAHALNFDQAYELFNYGKAKGIEVFFSVFGQRYVYWCEIMHVERYKIVCLNLDAKGERNVPPEAIRDIIDTGKPIIRSVYDVRDCWDKSNVENKVDNLYCVPHYPAPQIDVHLPYFNDTLTGFSDHTIGIGTAVTALERGAQIIEKHFVIKHEVDSELPDEKWAMDPAELKMLVSFDKFVQGRRK